MQIVTAARRVPLAGNYPAAVGMALLGLCPFIVLSTASVLFSQNLVRDLDTTMFGVALAAGLANATYSFGAVAAADLVQRVPPRYVFLACEAGFVLGSVLAAVAPGIVTFTLGRAIQGVTTGMLLVCALPPLVTNHGADRLPLTAAFVNLGLFGMTTLGPLVGGVVAGASAWRWLFAGVAGLGLLGLGTAVVSFERREPPAPGMGFDRLGIPLAIAATLLPFTAVSWLSLGSFTSPGFLIPLILGLGALVALIVGQYHKRGPLMPLRLLAHTLPVTGVSTAMLAGAAFTTLLELTVVYLGEVAGRPPAVVGALLATQLAGVAAAAWLFKAVLSTRWLPVLALSGLLVVGVAGVLLLAGTPQNALVIAPVAGVLLGFGAGAGVAPGLFMAGLSVPSTKLGATFALVELLRAEAAFLIAPVLLRIAMLGDGLAGGISLASAIVIVIVGLGAVALLALLLLGGARPHAPDLDSWLSGDSPAYHSPPVAARLRRVG